MRIENRRFFDERFAPVLRRPAIPPRDMSVPARILRDFNGVWAGPRRMRECFTERDILSCDAGWKN
jgi:hypothetical protein